MREAFYNDQNEVWGFTASPISIGAGGDEGDTDEDVLKDIEAQLTTMLKDFNATKDDIIVEEGFKFAEQTDITDALDAERKP